MKKIFFGGLMLMSFYFGAGNLIYPPTLGLASGHNFGWAATFFNLTAVVLPFLALLAVAISGGTSLSFAGRVNKPFAYVFTLIVLCATGPFFAIPRVANVTYDIAITPLIPTLADGSTLAIASPFGLVFLILFFFISYTLALYGEQLLDTIGKFISPVLIIFVGVLVFAFLFSGHQDVVAEPKPEYATVGKAVATGAIEGYQTLDALASVIFASLIMQTFIDDKSLTKKQLLSNVVKSGVVAVFFLGIIYVALGYIGKVTADSGKTSGTEILVFAAEQGLGEWGKFVFAIIVLLACLTTAVGLLKSLSEYMHNMFGLLTEKGWLTVFTLLSAVLSVQGLGSIIKVSVPMLFLIYPVIIVLVILTLLNKWTKTRAQVYYWAVGLTVPIAFADAFKLFSEMYFGAEHSVDLLGPVRNIVPFFDTQFTWVTPLVVGALVGWFMPKKDVQELELVDRNEKLREAKHKAADETGDVLGY